ncbi:MAG TPA: SDR family NAD(P)-dependent oxidoreductase [Polyangiaceae bacterium]|nr:SDR family NAD(P)-dependent oxidoreductase [Polyangiaceae bacterium]
MQQTTETRSARTTLVTGATGELGSAVIEYLAGLGGSVIAVDRPRARDRLAGLAKLGPLVRAVELDTDHAHAWLDRERWQPDGAVPDGAVLTAGAYAGGKRLVDEADDATLARLLESNLTSAYRALSALLKGMLPAGRGSIVLIGSKAAVRPWESVGSGAYAASKAGLLALVQSAAAETIGSGVRINAVLPSTIDTAPNRKAMPAADPSAWVSKQSLCDVIGFLLSDASRDVSGALIPVYGSRSV